MSTLTQEAQDELQEIGKQLALARKRRGFSARKFSLQLGLDRRTLADLEKGRPTVSLGAFFQVLSALGWLRGLREIVRPENDVEAIASEIRRLRRTPGSRAKRAIDEKKVDF